MKITKTTFTHPSISALYVTSPCPKIILTLLVKSNKNKRIDKCLKTSTFLRPPFVKDGLPLPVKCRGVNQLPKLAVFIYFLFCWCKNMTWIIVMGTLDSRNEVKIIPELIFKLEGENGYFSSYKKVSKWVHPTPI